MERQEKKTVDQLKQVGIEAASRRLAIENAAVRSLGFVALEWKNILTEVDLLTLRKKISATVQNCEADATTEEIADAVIHGFDAYFRSLQYESANPNMPVVGEHMSVSFEEDFLSNIRNVR